MFFLSKYDKLDLIGLIFSLFFKARMCSFDFNSSSSWFRTFKTALISSVARLACWWAISLPMTWQKYVARIPSLGRSAKSPSSTNSRSCLPIFSSTKTQTLCYWASFSPFDRPSDISASNCILTSSIFWVLLHSSLPRASCSQSAFLSDSWCICEEVLISYINSYIRCDWFPTCFSDASISASGAFFFLVVCSFFFRSLGSLLNVVYLVESDGGGRSFILFSSVMRSMLGTCRYLSSLDHCIHL